MVLDNQAKGTEETVIPIQPRTMYEVYDCMLIGFCSGGMFASPKGAGTEQSVTILQVKLVAIVICGLDHSAQYSEKKSPKLALCFGFGTGQHSTHSLILEPYEQPTTRRKTLEELAYACWILRFFYLASFRWLFSWFRWHTIRRICAKYIYIYSVRNEPTDTCPLCSQIRWFVTLMRKGSNNRTKWTEQHKLNPRKQTPSNRI